MEEFIIMLPTIVIIIFVMVISIAGSAAKTKSQKSGTKSLHQKAMVDTRNKQRTDAHRAKATKADYHMMEDRDNDWLARQRREEAASEKRFSAMYGLKREHAANCDARRLRNEHYGSCNADGVDIGSGR